MERLLERLLNSRVWAPPKEGGDPDPDPDDSVIRGAPQDGDPFLPEPEPEPEPAPPPPPAPDPMEVLRSELEAVRGELSSLKQEKETMQRGENFQQQIQQEDDDLESIFENFEGQFYTDPKAAMRGFATSLEKRIEDKLTTRYQQTRGQDTFWESFYRDNPDLANDKDVVNMVLSANVDVVGDLPIEQGAKKLAELTRERLLRIAGGNKVPGKKAQVEGHQSPTPAPLPDKEEEVVSLSDVLRKRKLARSKAAAAE